MKEGEEVRTRIEGIKNRWGENKTKTRTEGTKVTRKRVRKEHRQCQDSQKTVADPRHYRSHETKGKRKEGTFRGESDVAGRDGT